MYRPWPTLEWCVSSSRIESDKSLYAIAWLLLVTPALAQPALTSSFTTPAAAAWARLCPEPPYPAAWVWGADEVPAPRSATHGRPKIEQIRNGRVIATYRSLADGPGCDYHAVPTWQSPSGPAASGCGPFTRVHAYRLWAPGDTFLVYPAIYGGDENQPWFGPMFDSDAQYADGHGTPTPMHDITVTGITQGGERPVILVSANAANNTLGQGSIYFDKSKNVKFGGINLVAVKGAWVGRAGIYDVGASDLTLHDMRVSNFAQQGIDGAMGVFGAGQYEGYLHMERMELDHNGGQNGPAHNAYINASATDPNFTVSFTNSWSHDSYYGHLFKSRAQHTIIEGSYFQGGRPQPGHTQAEAFLLDVPNGGKLQVTNSIFVKTASGHESNGVAISYYEEGDAEGGTPRDFSVDIENNTFLAMAATYDGTHPNFPFWIKRGHGDVTVKDNVFGGWCPAADEIRNYRGSIALTVPPSDFTEDFALRSKYTGEAGPAQGQPAYLHETATGAPRKLTTIGARD
jgi:hypothetical protein